MKKILVTTDGSKNSEKALLEAREIGEVLSAEINILTVIKEPRASNPYPKGEEHIIEALRGRADEILENSLKAFEGCKLEIKTKIRVGDPGNEIIKEVEEEKYYLVIMGSRGLGTFPRAMLGSISNKVLNHVKTNVLIVK